ncbi:LysE family translocator [Kribbella sp. CA-293567]|uniref:LysE family translocator n=1 Tax=Kribbella sp. CA-293567 TaxID=3002436 RepID=UPI0022DE3E4D|nr:LysE family translocator [Kribbella sp. CA-293567]WBQ02030.1 LysE family translocator [Kribbella sp. CA-293567]
MGIGQALGFVGATVVLVGMPGPNNIYISLRSLTQGRRAGVVSAFAIETGSIVYILLTALGLAAVVQASPVVFTAISLAGAAYLAVLGIRSLRSGDAAGIGAVQVTSLGRIFREGVLVNLLNPKAALFFLAFLPQFTTRGAGTGQVRNEMLLLGLAVLVIGLLLDLTYALGADALARRFRTAGRRRGLGRYVVAGIYLTIAAVAALSVLA